MLTGKGLLDPLQKEFLEVFAALPGQEQFYFTGGTALAEFYLGHRLSYDLDFFTPEAELIIPFSYEVERRCAQRGLTAAVVRRFASYVEFSVAREEARVKVDLAQDSPFQFAPPQPCEYGVMVNSLVDIRVDKLLAYYGRAEPRDAVDLYWIMQQIPVQPLLEQASQKDTGFDRYWLAVALNRAEHFPDEQERWPVKMLQPFDPVALKRSFAELAQSIMDELSRK